MVLEKEREKEREGGGRRERVSIKLFKNRVAQLFTYKNRDFDTCKPYEYMCFYTYYLVLS